LGPKSGTDSRGATRTLTATAADSAGKPVSGVRVVFKVSGANTATGTRTTDASGQASLTYTGKIEGFDTISAFADNDTNGSKDAGEPSDSARELWFTPMSGGGTFVIGDQNAQQGAAVTYWGAKWWKDNTLSGGSAPASFKGFADTTTTKPPSCGQPWTTGPGNSSGPPAHVPAFMPVIVSGSISKAGPTISGDAPSVVVVQTQPGYGPNPGHAGYGTVVGVVCHS
jgi:hypothetical protein